MELISFSNSDPGSVLSSVVDHNGVYLQFDFCPQHEASDPAENRDRDSLPLTELFTFEHYRPLSDAAW